MDDYNAWLETVPTIVDYRKVLTFRVDALIASGKIPASQRLAILSAMFLPIAGDSVREIHTTTKLTKPSQTREAIAERRAARLAKREKAIAMAGRGVSIKAIAKKLKLNYHTVEKYLHPERHYNPKMLTAARYTSKRR